MPGFPHAMPLEGFIGGLMIGMLEKLFEIYWGQRARMGLGLDVDF